jgi:hypothetical protein
LYLLCPGQTKVRNKSEECLAEVFCLNYELKRETAS